MANALKNIPVGLRTNLGVPFFVLLILSMMILPLSPFVLDLLFTFGMVFSLIILLSSVYVKKSLDFAIFPSVILVATLFRLALNIASTRVILLHGNTGTGAAGHVIEAFGNVVVGGNYAVGFVVFSILIVINFVVITKGAGRISEVSARFTLDSMPGKQMAVDADLNAGLITQDEAKLRRAEISQEADFYGSMDGASKFVRGDAIAGILVLVINIVGGLAIGMTQHDMPFSDALRNYTLLTIGDGLVSQVPALLLSVAAAIITTKASSSDQDIEKQFSAQLFRNPRVLTVTAAIMGVLGAIPGMPHFAFLTLALFCYGLSYYLKNYVDLTALAEEMTPTNKKGKAKSVSTADVAHTGGETKPNKRKELDWDDLKSVDTIGLEVGYRLIVLVDEKQGGQLMKRIRGIRKKVSQELGFLVPPVHIRDNLDLGPHTYRISIMGVSLGEADIIPEKMLAISGGQSLGNLTGEPTIDPAFGLDALWITPAQQEEAQALGLTVVDPATVIATHLSNLIQSNACQLLGHAETQQLLDKLAEDYPKLVQELVPDTLSIATIVKILQGLLDEKIPLRDPKTIVETLASNAHQSQDPDALLVKVREKLSRLIVQTIYGNRQELPVITLDPALEQILQQSLQASGREGLALEPNLADTLQQSLTSCTETQEMQGEPAVLLVAGPLRPILSRFARFSVPNLHVLAYQEIPDNKRIRIVGSVGQSSLSEMRAGIH